MSAKEQLFDIINSSDAVHKVAEGLSDTQRVFMSGDIGFERGRKAQKAESRRKRRAEKRKEATAHD